MTTLTLEQVQQGIASSVEAVLAKAFATQAKAQQLPTPATPVAASPVAAMRQEFTEQQFLTLLERGEVEIDGRTIALQQDESVELARTAALSPRGFGNSLVNVALGGASAVAYTALIDKFLPTTLGSGIVGAVVKSGGALWLAPKVFKNNNVARNVAIGIVVFDAINQVFDLKSMIRDALGSFTFGMGQSRQADQYQQYQQALQSGSPDYSSMGAVSSSGNGPDRLAEVFR